ncbi:c-type cytochrome [Planctomycetales bacterium ZRK34]|nr:c-type cytochrome [Planctomycetales bacterium ZRK34]
MFNPDSLITIAAMALMLMLGGNALAEAPYRSPQATAYSPDGARLAVTDYTAANVSLIDPAAGKVVAQVKLNGRPTDVIWSLDGKKLYVSEQTAGTVAEIDAAGAKVVRRLEVGPWPMGLAIAAKPNRLLVCEASMNRLEIVDLGSGKVVSRVDVLRQPFAVAVTPDQSTALVSNLLPEGPSTDPAQAAAVSVIDLNNAKCIKNIRLPAGSSAVRDVVCAADGGFGYVVHTLGRTNLPTTQLERGWVNTNALSVINLKDKSLHATVLLDHPMQGAADPWGISLSPDGNRLWVTLSGVHRLAWIDMSRLPSLFDDNRAALVNDLAALYRNGLIHPIDLPGHGPRGLSVSPDGKTVAVAMYFDGAAVLVDAEAGKVKSKISLGDQPAVSQARLGERIFHDASYCFQSWLSCATCHPDTRVDGLNWDLLNDGLGNPKNAKSMVWSDRTPPAMSLGVREGMEAAAEAGFVHIQFRVVDKPTLEATQAYLRTLEPVASPYLVNGKLSEAAQRGKAIFNDKAVGCANCHPAPLYTDLKKHGVETRSRLDRHDAFDTPTLVELWRTGPYLHSGAAATLRDVLTTQNEKDVHGHTKHLTPQQIDDLIAFLNSL